MPVQLILNPPSNPVQPPVAPAGKHRHARVKPERASSDLVVIPTHPDIIPAPHDWRLGIVVYPTVEILYQHTLIAYPFYADGGMCRVKWGDNLIAVYITSNERCLVGLYQV